MENLTISGKKYLKTNNYIFKKSNVNSISTIFSKYKILIKTKLQIFLNTNLEIKFIMKTYLIVLSIS